MFFGKFIGPVTYRGLAQDNVSGQRAEIHEIIRKKSTYQKGYIEQSLPLSNDS